MKQTTLDKTRNVYSFLKKNWITVWLAVAGSAFAAFVAIASYTEVSTVKRVASTQSTPERLFSSNCMKYGGSRKQMSSTQYTVTVCNYDQNFPKVYNPVAVEYALTAKLQLKIGDNYWAYDELGDPEKGNLSGEALMVAQRKFEDNAGEYGIQMTADDDSSNTSYDNTAYVFSASANYTVTYPGQSLTANVSSTDKFEVTIPEVDLTGTDPEWFVYVEADPVDTSLFTLFSRLYGAESESVESTWKGELVETDTARVNYDFYNYRLTGSSSGTLDIMWDPEWLEPNPFFFSPLAGNPFTNGNSTPVTFTDETHINWEKVTLTVNGENPRYDLQLFKAKAQTSYTGNNNAANYIDCKFHPAS